MTDENGKTCGGPPQPASQKASCVSAATHQRGIDRRIIVAGYLLFVFLFANALCVSCFAQNDFYPLPTRNDDRFGFPYPAPSADEPGVSFTRRYMLDGHPELQFNPRPEDEIWLVSTRNISSEQACHEIHNGQFVCKRASGNEWIAKNLNSLIQDQTANLDMPTVVFIHGNRTPAFWARRRGKQAYQAWLGNQTSGRTQDAPPVRFIIWSWPSDPVQGFFQDFFVKMQRSLVDGRLFGHFISQLNSHRPTNVVAYSLGVQVALSGIEAAAEQSGKHSLINLIGMAPVTTCQWPASDYQLAETSKQINELVFCRNDHDIAIRAFRAFCRIENGETFSPGADSLVRVRPDARQYDVSRGVGREHNVISYLSQPIVRAELRSFLDR